MFCCVPKEIELIFESAINAFYFLKLKYDVSSIKAVRINRIYFVHNFDYDKVVST